MFYHAATVHPGDNASSTGDSQDALEQWCKQPVANNLQIFNLVRAYHEKVICPEYYTLVFQLEAGLRSVDSRVFAVRRELGWMAAENRQAQKYECGVQLLTTGWPNALAPAHQEYMICWLLSQTPKVTHFLKFRGFLTDQNAHELTRYLNALKHEPTTVPQREGFFSTMMLLTFKAFEIRIAVLEKFGGSTGIRLYQDEDHPLHASISRRHLVRHSGKGSSRPL